MYDRFGFMSPAKVLPDSNKLKKQKAEIPKKTSASLNSLSLPLIPDACGE